jgi:hypothetical protein
MEENQVIHEFQKNANEKVRAEFCEYKGRDYFNLRVFFQSDGPDEEWFPTRKGFTMCTSLLPDLKEAVDLAYQQWQKKAYKEMREEKLD